MLRNVLDAMCLTSMIVGSKLVALGLDNLSAEKTNEVREALLASLEGRR